MLGDNDCSICNGPCACQSEDCGCSDSPCLPGPDGAECGDWVKAECVFWMEDDIVGTPIKKGARLTEVVTYLMARIVDHENRLVAGTL